MATGIMGGIQALAVGPQILGLTLPPYTVEPRSHCYSSLGFGFLVWGMAWLCLAGS